MASKYHHTILITGATSGLGYECALSIARQCPDVQIIIASRSDPNACANSINHHLGQSNVEFIRLDLSSLAKIRQFVSEWEAKSFPSIQAMVMNAALQFPGQVDYTEDGFERTFAISHIGHALLFNLLRSHLADTARVVIVSSGTHDPAQRTGMPTAVYNSAEELAHPTPETCQYKGRQRYTSTKLANVLYTYALDDHFRRAAQKSGGQTKWTASAIDPGLMPGTGLARQTTGIQRFLWFHVLPAILPLLRLLVSKNIHSPKESGEAVARLAVGEDVQGQSGVYYEGTKPIKSSDASYDKSKQEDLWTWTAKTLARDEVERSRFELRDIL
ncbi:NAD(P)-binding domain protein [Metarhizium guizhouense ARSEF 977]|uniref:NAD(P)-binding domain protein n=1 Tax=Metarhizium guizhouense (strain ARSEF 977) TaxID=1276136 RepID=A0A0B4HQK5_METGA|nr:NAD(P)-binding domain protein [Metarhizium guizhouense ARSEF 977]